MTKRLHLGTLLLSLLLTACIEPTTPDFQLEGPFYLVEGDIADRVGLSEVRVRQSNFRTVQLEFEDVAGATVVAEERAGSQVQWQASEADPGRYLPPTDFRARAGEEWSLRVTFPDGTEAVSTPEVVPPQSQVQDVRLRFDQEGRFEEARGRFVPVFRVLLDSSDPAGEQNYYQWDYRYWELETVCATCIGGRYRDGVCIPDNVIDRNKQDFDYLCEGEDGCYREVAGGRFLFASDQAFDGGQLMGNEIGNIVFTQFGGLLVEGIQYGLTADAFAYGRTVNNLVEGNSGLNATIPAALNGNLTNVDPTGPDVLGYVRAVSVASDRQYIFRDADTGEPVGRDRPINLEPIVGAFVPPMAPCTGSGRTPVRPAGWPE